ncbi:hypothetical protein CPB83DRAFT_858162 [Crepidotus variabilis]|uniref:Uncharacterized protein n=1 Tax=Crepidotus variabilis TaxID=179855 RepID=A0A9P6JMH6_9AGAR|nr:hypothetical protein CPB83DRAFT_858162 [Crepidotus variabilis]
MFGPTLADIPPPSYDDIKSLMVHVPCLASMNPDSKDFKQLAQLADDMRRHEDQTSGDIQKRMVESIGNLDAAETLKDLTSNIHNINDSFVKISISLGILDDKCYRKKNGNGSNGGDVIEKFRPTWDHIHKDFGDLIWDSRRIATEAAGHAQAFREVLIPIIESNEPSLEEKKRELKTYIEDLEKSQTAAQQMSSSFSSLPARIKDVQVRIGVALNAVGGNFERRIDYLRNDIVKLTQELDKYNKLADIALWVCVGGVAVAGAGGLMALTGIMAPAAKYVMVAGAIIGLGGAITEIVALKKANSTLREIDHKKEEINRLTKEHITFKEVQANVEMTLQDSEGLCQRLNAIGSVWAEIRTDAQIILQAIIKAEKSPQHSFRRYLGETMVRDPYRKLEELLILYANSVTAAS